MDDKKYPSNAKKDKVTKVVKGSVRKKQETLGTKVKRNFFSMEADSIGDYIVNDILIPAVKSTVTDMVQSGIEILLYGEKKGYRRRDDTRGRVNYTSYSSRDRERERERDRDRYRDRRRSTRMSYEDILLDTRAEAEEVLSCLVDLTEDYGQATIGDFYDLIGVTGDFTDTKYGWRDLSTARVVRERDGFSIDFPRAKAIN